MASFMVEMVTKQAKLWMIKKKYNNVKRIQLLSSITIPAVSEKYQNSV
jgi:hypothetical protein